MPADDLLLREHRVRAEQRLAAAAGDATLCVIGRSGGSFREVKYREGAAAALMEVERRARGGSVEAALSETTTSWRGGLDVAHRRFGADWIAYRQGGLDELEALGAAIEAADV